MAVEERRRLEMFERLMEVLGVEVADTLLAHLPPQGERVATRDQVEHLRAETRDQVERLRAETRDQVEQVRTEVGQLRVEVDGKLASLGNELRASWRRDLLLISVPQFLALMAILAGIGA